MKRERELCLSINLQQALLKWNNYLCLSIYWFIDWELFLATEIGERFLLSTLSHQGEVCDVVELVGGIDTGLI